MTITKEDYDDMFDIPIAAKGKKKGATDVELDQPEIPAEDTNKTYEDRINDMTEEIGGFGPTKKLEFTRVESEIPEKESEKSTNLSTEDILSQATSKSMKESHKDYIEVFMEEEVIDEVKEEEKGVSNDNIIEEKEENIAGENKEISNNIKEENMVDKEEKFLDNSPFKWSLESDTPQLKKFYEGKERLLSRILSSGEMHFDVLFKELKGYKIDIPKSNYDMADLMLKLNEIHVTRERVKEIQIQVNRQQQLCEDSLTSLRGVLLYTLPPVKPAENREGVVHLHLRDMQEYFSELNALQKNADLSAKVLDHAYDTISRQITIVATILTSDPDRRGSAVDKTLDAKKEPSKDFNLGGETDKDTIKEPIMKSSTKGNLIDEDFDSVEDVKNSQPTKEEKEATTSSSVNLVKKSSIEDMLG